jgi:hypothetical protein
MIEIYITLAIISTIFLIFALIVNPDNPKHEKK